MSEVANALANLRGIAENAEDEELEQIKKQVKAMKTSFQDLSKAVTVALDALSKEVDKVNLRIDILANKSTDIRVEGGRGGDATGGSVSADIDGH